MDIMNDIHNRHNIKTKIYLHRHDNILMEKPEGKEMSHFIIYTLSIVTKY